MFFPGTSRIHTASPSLQEGPHMLTLFLFWWLISFPWKVDNQCPSEKVTWLVLAPYSHHFLGCT